MQIILQLFQRIIRHFFSIIMYYDDFSSLKDSLRIHRLDIRYYFSFFNDSLLLIIHRLNSFIITRLRLFKIAETIIECLDDEFVENLPTKRIPWKSREKIRIIISKN